MDAGVELCVETVSGCGWRWEAVGQVTRPMVSQDKFIIRMYFIHFKYKDCTRYVIVMCDLNILM